MADPKIILGARGMVLKQKKYKLWGGVLPLNYVNNSYLFDKFVEFIELVIAIKSGQLGSNADNFKLMFSADILDFLFLVQQ